MIDALARKLGVSADRPLWVDGAPADLILPTGTSDPAAAHVFLFFVAYRAAVEPALDRALTLYRRGRSLWFAYPKKSGSIRTDLSRDMGWDALTAADLLGVAQIALDADWSALRFRYRDEIKLLTRKQDVPGA